MAARLVEMKSYLLLPQSEEGERLKQEFTGQLIEYDPVSYTHLRGIHAAHLLDEGAGHRLVVGDHGQGLHGGGAKGHLSLIHI